MSKDVRDRTVIGGLIVLVVLNLGLLSIIWFGRPGPDRGPGPNDGPPPNPDEFMVRELGLTDNQAQAVQLLRRQQMKYGDSLRMEVYQLGRELRTLIFAGSGDTARIRILSEAIGDRHAALELQLYEHFRDIGLLCDSAQREKLGVIVDEIMKGAQLPPDPPPGNRPPGGVPPPPR
jgi:Spy/CpxP family protein refolding chaperone